MYYASKKFLVTVDRAEANGELHTIDGTLPIFKNDIISTDQYGNQAFITDDYFYTNYVPVRKMRKSKQPVKSPFEEAYARQLVEFGSLDNSIEDDQYINGTLEISKN